MKVFILKSDLMQALSVVKLGIASNPILPIMENVKLTIKEGFIRLQSTDNNISVTKDILNAKVEGEGSFLIQGQAVKLISALKEGEIKIEHKENLMIISQGRSKYKFPSEDVIDFPKVMMPGNLEDSQEACVEFGNFATSLIDAVYFVSKNESQVAMTGVLLQIEDNELTITATDAHTLTTTVIESPSMKPLKEPAKLIIPQKLISLLKVAKSNTDFCTLNFTQNKLCLSFGNTIISSTLIDENYPNYKAVIPDDSVGSILLNKKSFLNCIKRLILLSNKITNAVAMTYNETGFVMSSNDLDFATDGLEIVTDNVEIDMPNEGFFGFNGILMTNLLNTLKQDTVKIELGSDDGRRPMLIKEFSESVSRTTLIMPIMLSEDFDYKSIVEKIK